MANPKKPSTNKQENLAVALRITYAESLRRMEDQTSLAREMVKRVHEMCDRAEEMRKPPRFVRPR